MVRARPDHARRCSFPTQATGRKPKCSKCKENAVKAAGGRHGQRLDLRLKPRLDERLDSILDLSLDLRLDSGLYSRFQNGIWIQDLI